MHEAAARPSPAFDAESHPLRADGTPHRHAHLPPVRRGYLVLLLAVLIPPLSTDRPADFNIAWAGARGLRLVGRVERRIREHALVPPTDRDLFEVAIAAMLARVGDQYTQFMPAQLGRDTRNLLDDATPGGVGAQVRAMPPPDGGLEIQSFLPYSPAEDAGLRVGDRIVEIDRAALDGLPPPAMIGRLRGPPDTPVLLTYLRDGARHEILLNRQRLPAEMNVVHRLLPGPTRIGYIRLNVFSRRAPAQMAGAVRELSEEGMRALVIDLRGNQGGELQSAQAAADLFLDRGVITTVERRTVDRLNPGQPAGRMEVRASPAVIGRYPIAILMDGETASAAELFAAALRENNVARLFGAKSFGKSAIQDFIPLDAGGAAMRLTTGRYLTPEGRDIGGVGLFPDYPVALNDEEQLATRFMLERARYGGAAPEGWVDPVLQTAREWLARLHARAQSRP